jgi:hypothetical protein
MRRRLDLRRLYRRALHAMPETVDDRPPLPVAAGSPPALGELLAEP